MLYPRLVGRAAALALLAAGGCALSPPPSRSQDALDPTLRSSTFIEEGNLVALVVGTRPARLRLAKPYVPFEIAVVNKGLSSLSLTPESFTLISADGKRYAAVGRDELTRSYGGNTDLDRRFAEATEAVHSRFASYSIVPSNLTPGFDRPIALDRPFLHRFSYMVDFIYFPRPDAAVLHEPIELFVQAPELEDPVFVRFQIARPKRGAR